LFSLWSAESWIQTPPRRLRPEARLGSTKETASTVSNQLTTALESRYKLLKSYR